MSSDLIMEGINTFAQTLACMERRGLHVVSPEASQPRLLCVRLGEGRYKAQSRRSVKDAAASTDVSASMRQLATRWRMPTTVHAPPTNG